MEKKRLAPFSPRVRLAPAWQCRRDGGSIKVPGTPIAGWFIPENPVKWMVYNNGWFIMDDILGIVTPTDFMDGLYIWDVILPIDEIICFRGVG